MSILKNYSYNLVYQITLIILPALSIPYISRVIGAQGIGVYAFTNSIMQYFLIFANLGLSIYASREIAYIKEDISKRSKLFTEIIIIQFIATFIVLSAYYLYVFTFCKLYANLYLIQSISILAVAFDISWFYIGIEDFKKNVIRNIVVKIAAFILLFLIIKTSDDLWKYILLTVVSMFFGQIYMWFGIGKFVQKMQLKELNIIQHINKTKFFFLILIISVIGVNLNKILIGLFVNTTELGKYDMAYKLIIMALVLITSLGTVMSPRISTAYIREDFNGIKKYLRLSIQFTLFLSFFAMTLLIVISGNFVEWFFGNQFKGTALYLILLSPMMLLNSLSNLLACQFMIPSGNEKKYFISIVFGSVIGILSSIVLIPKFSVIGACISVLIGESSVLIAHIIQVRNHTVLNNIIGKWWQFVFASLPVILFSYFLKEFVSNPILLTFSQSITGIISYVGILYMMKNEFILHLINKFKLILNP